LSISCIIRDRACDKRPHEPHGRNTLPRRLEHPPLCKHHDVFAPCRVAPFIVAALAPPPTEVRHAGHDIADEFRGCSRGERIFGGHAIVVGGVQPGDTAHCDARDEETGCTGEVPGIGAVDVDISVYPSGEYVGAGERFVVDVIRPGGSDGAVWWGCRGGPDGVARFKCAGAVEELEDLFKVFGGAGSSENGPVAGAEEGGGAEVEVFYCT
jgi:hypothetical protein